MFDIVKDWFVTNLEWVVVQRILGVLFMTTLARTFIGLETKNLVFFGCARNWHFYNSIFAKWPIPFEKQYYLSSCLSNSAANSFHFDRYSK